MEPMTEPPRGPGRPRRSRPADTPVTAPGVEPVVTIGDLDALADRLQLTDRASFAESLGITRGHLSHLYAGSRQIVPSALLVLIHDRLREHGLLRAARQGRAAGAGKSS